MGGWNLQVHTTPRSEDEPEQMVSDEEHLTTDELVFRMGTLSMIADTILADMAQQMASDLDAELEAFFNSQD
jgi:hypothetical protein